MGITAKELAARLNLSATAVSMALNGKPGVSTETRALVIREAEKAGYDFSRLSMKKNVTGDIYCIICRAHNAILNYTPIFSELTEGIEQECRKNGYHLKTFQLYEKADDLQKYIEELRISQCAGVILLGTEVSASVCHEFLQLSVPVVLLDSYFDSADCSCVLSNNAQGAYQKLIAKIAALTPGNGSVDQAVFDEQKEKFRKAMGNDLNTSLGITALYDALKVKANDETKLALLADFDRVLSLDLLAKAEAKREADAKAKASAASDGGIVITGEGDPAIDALVLQRAQAKKAKNFAEADRIRDELKAMGIEVTDTKDGASWRRV